MDIIIPANSKFIQISAQLCLYFGESPGPSSPKQISVSITMYVILNKESEKMMAGWFDVFLFTYSLSFNAKKNI